MARRLLSEKFESIDYEQMFITKLKLSCGFHQIKKLEGMLSDLNVAKQEIKEFEAFNQANAKAAVIDFQV